MSKSDRLRDVAFGLIVLVLAGAFGLTLQLVRASEQRSQAIAQASQQDAECQPENYYNCADLNAQAGMRRATDALVTQGKEQFWLGIVNLVLLIGTLGASVVATFVAARAVKVAREEMENGLAPRLAVVFDDMNWDPLKKGLDPLEGVGGLLGDTDPDATHFHFHNFGEAAAYYTMLYARHYCREAKDGYPPPIRIFKLKNFSTFPEGNWVKSGHDTQKWRMEVDEDIADELLPKTKDRFWFVMGFVVYEGLHGVRYMTQFCFYYDTGQKKFLLGEPGEITSFPFNGTRRVTRRWFNWLKREELFDAQHHHGN